MNEDTLKSMTIENIIAELSNAKKCVEQLNLLKDQALADITLMENYLKEKGVNNVQ